MGGPFLRAGRHGFGSPRRFAAFLVVVEGLDQASQHFCRGLEKRLGLRLWDFFNVFAQVINELTHPDLDLLRVPNGVYLGGWFHTSTARPAA